MGRPRQKDRQAKAWVMQVGLKPHTVTAFERPDKGLTVWLRWTPLGGRRPPQKMSLGFKLRDGIGDRLDPVRRADAEQKAKDSYNRLLKGEDPRTPHTSDTDSETGDGVLSIAAGLEAALMVPTGMFPVETDHVADMRRYKKHVLAHLPPGVARWDKLTPITYQALWRNIAHWRVKQGVRTRTGEVQGKRAANLAVVLLAQAARWLWTAGLVSDPPHTPRKGWEDQFESDWARITDDPQVDHPTLRHSPEEMGRLFSAVDQRIGDRRIGLALQTAGEARLGQALRCDRTALDLSPIGAYAAGRFTIPDTGKKKGAVVDLTADMRAAWEFELAQGYLCHLESEYSRGKIRTYPLFPGGRLVKGRVRAGVRHPIGKRGALDLFHELERLAGVEVVEGRGWYGIRRIAADLAEDVEKDGRALNAITGHQSDEMRRQVYQDKERDAIRAKAAEARVAARALAIEAARNTAADVRRMRVLSTDAQPREKKPRGARKAPTYPPKLCEQCGTEFVPTGPNSRACESCSPRRVRPAKNAASLTPRLTPE